MRVVTAKKGQVLRDFTESVKGIIILLFSQNEGYRLMSKQPS
jgi:hypothetical protein